MITYRSLNDYLRESFGSKVYKLALSTSCTCPNRDGTLGTSGCIFCSAGGSGEFAQSSLLPVAEQIERAKQLVSRKVPENARYIAYFQSYTNTYAPAFQLRPLFTEAIMHPDVVALSIATRPDCLPPDILDLLAELNEVKPVWVELGLQTIHASSAAYIRRGYALPVFDQAVRALHARGISVIVHLILGLPGETVSDMRASARYVSDCLMENKVGADGRSTDGRCANGRSTDGPDTDGRCADGRCADGQDTDGRRADGRCADGLKFHLLHVLRGTDLEQEYRLGRVPVMSMEAYFDALAACLAVISPDLIIHRLTGDGAKKDLIAPLWSANKKAVLNAWREYCRKDGSV